MQREHDSNSWDVVVHHFPRPPPARPAFMITTTQRIRPEVRADPLPVGDLGRGTRSPAARRGPFRGNTAPVARSRPRLLDGGAGRGM